MTDARDERIAQLETECRKLTAMLDDTLRAEHELERRLATPGEGDVCWHCRVCLVPEPAHCDECPAFGDCDVLGCDEPGCNDEAPTEEQVAAVYDGRTECDLRVENGRLRRLLRRVIEDVNDPATLLRLSEDIARELGVPNPLARN